MFNVSILKDLSMVLYKFLISTSFIISLSPFNQASYAVKTNSQNSSMDDSSIPGPSVSTSKINRSMSSSSLLNKKSLGGTSPSTFSNYKDSETNGSGNNLNGEDENGTKRSSLAAQSRTKRIIKVRARNKDKTDLELMEIQAESDFWFDRNSMRMTLSSMYINNYRQEAGKKVLKQLREGILNKELVVKMLKDIELSIPPKAMECIQKAQKDGFPEANLALAQHSIHKKKFHESDFYFRNALKNLVAAYAAIDNKGFDDQALLKVVNQSQRLANSNSNFKKIFKEYQNHDLFKKLKKEEEKNEIQYSEDTKQLLTKFGESKQNLEDQFIELGVLEAKTQDEPIKHNFSSHFEEKLDPEIKALIKVLNLSGINLDEDSEEKSSKSSKEELSLKIRTPNTSQTPNELLFEDETDQ